MNDQHPGPASIPTPERVATVGGASANAMSHKAKGEAETQMDASHSLDLAQAQVIIEAWPEAPKRVAGQMLKQYGAPNEATATKLFWYRAGPWKRILVTSDVITHNFPAPHSDFITQWIDYQVPVEKFDEIGRFDGSCLVDRTAGEAAARCDSEAANMITLNLMHEIVTGAKTVDEARKVYAENMAAYLVGRPAPYAERLMFATPAQDTHDPDQSMISGAMMHQGLGKVKDVVTGSEGSAPT